MNIFGLHAFAAEWGDAVHDCEVVVTSVDTDAQETVKTSYKWQINNINLETWEVKLTEKVEKLGLAYIWQR
jgi:hypothetical protein